MPTSIQLASEVKEKLAELEHEQWIAWSKNIAETEKITPARLERWNELWCLYSILTEAQKDQDREWGDKSVNYFITLIEKLKEETDGMRILDNADTFFKKLQSEHNEGIVIGYTKAIDTFTQKLEDILQALKK